MNPRNLTWTPEESDLADRILKAMEMPGIPEKMLAIWKPGIILLITEYKLRIRATTLAEVNVKVSGWIKDLE